MNLIKCFCFVHFIVYLSINYYNPEEKIYLKFPHHFKTKSSIKLELPQTWPLWLYCTWLSFIYGCSCCIDFLEYAVFHLIPYSINHIQICFGSNLLSILILLYPHLNCLSQYSRILFFNLILLHLFRTLIAYTITS